MIFVDIAAYLSDATKPFLPFKFANSVKIIDVTQRENHSSQGRIPIHKNHNHTMMLTKAEIASASNTIYNDSTMVEDLLERNLLFNTIIMILMVFLCVHLISRMDDQTRYTINYNIPLVEGVALKKLETKIVVYNNKSSSQLFDFDYDLVGGLATD